MEHVTKIAAIENATAIWEYDPSSDDNRVLNGSLDVIAAIRTIAIKVRDMKSMGGYQQAKSLQIQASSQRIEYFNQLQTDCDINPPLRIPLHSNVRWGSAHNMLTRAHALQQPINHFISTADQRFGPMTTLRKNGKVIKHIPWGAAKMSRADWQRVADVRDVLEV